MRLFDILPPNVARLLPQEAHGIDITHVTHDSRHCAPGTLFAAWQGAQADGHGYVPSARQHGAVFVVCERPLADDTPHLVVQHPRRVLALAAARLYAASVNKLQLVGLTGTNGKTTCAHLISSMLAAAHGQAIAIGTLGETRFTADEDMRTAPIAGTLTTPEASDVQRILADAQQRGVKGAALEVTSIALAQGRADGITLDVAAMTNLTQDHLDVHGTMQAYGAAKALLFSQHTKTDGVFVFNAHDAFQRTLPQGNHRTLFFGHAARVDDLDVDVWPQSVNMQRDRTRCLVRTPRGDMAIDSSLVGDFNVENLLLALAVAEALGLQQHAVQAGIKNLHAVPGRLERFGGNGGKPLVLVDYAHTPDALERALRVARTLTPAGKVICVFGCGGDRDAKKRPLMGRIASRHADRVIVTNDNPRTEDPAHIADAIEAGIKGARASVTRTLDRALAIQAAIVDAQEQDTVLVAGKGHETYQIIGKKTEPFDDREQVKRCLD